MSGAERGFKVRALGEVAIRCADLAKMAAFYRDIIGHEPLEGDYSGHIRFFKVTEGFAGHTALLALFHADDDPAGDLSRTDKPPAAGRDSSLHHLALTLPFEEQEAAMRWYDDHGIDYRVQEFAWIGWRGVFTSDPEGNTVELVAYDPASGRPTP